MPLLPRLLTPFFGMSLGELLFGAYIEQNYPYAPPPTFLGLGAGKAYFDHDLIKHITSPLFILPEYAQHAKSFREISEFIVSDITENGTNLIRQELADIVKKPQLQNRVSVLRIDAKKFQMEKRPYGISYSNELIDNLRTEPVVLIEDQYYCVKIMAYDTSNRPGDNKDLIKIEEKINRDGIVTREFARKIIDQEKGASLRYIPVFIDIDHDKTIRENFYSLSSSGNIKAPEFGGIYPLHLDLDGFFQSQRNSFEKGLCLVIDYPSIKYGMHNWNKTVNAFRTYRFGQDDIDFQIDPDQVIEKASRYDIQLIYNDSLSATFEKTQDFMNLISKEDYDRFVEKNTFRGRKPTPEEFIITYCLLVKGMANAWRVMIFKY